jgi:hypothetical protein
MDFTTLKIKRVNKTRVFYGKIVHHVEFDDTFIMTENILKKQGGEYRLLPFKVDATPACSFYQQDKVVYSELANVSD